MTTKVNAMNELNQPYALTSDQLDQFRRDGYIKLKQMLSPDVLNHYGECITRKVIELNPQAKPMAQRNTYEKAFL